MFPWAAAFLSMWQDFLFFVSYITGSNVFPQPLSEQDEEKFLNAMMQGDNEAKNILIERNLRLVAHVVKKFDGTGESVDDLISIGTIGLIKGINTFQRDKNTRLATYAARCIENEILMHLRMTKKNRHDVLLYEPIGADKEGNELNLIDVLGTEPEIVQEQVESRLEEETLYSKMAALTARENLVIRMRYGLTDGIKRTQREISRILGISRSYVSRIEKKALRKLKKELQNDGYQ